MKMLEFQFEFHWNFKGPIDNKWALVRRTGENPFPEPMLSHFTDAYMRHQGEMS